MLNFINILRENTPALSLLILVHPGSACGSADFNLGEEEAEIGRAKLIADMAAHFGPVLVVDGELSDELVHYPQFDAAIDRACDTDGSDSVYADDGMGGIWPKHVVGHVQAMGFPVTTSIKVTGTWYFRDDSAGCVNAVYKALRSAGFRNVDISANAMVDPAGDADERYEEGV